MTYTISFNEANIILWLMIILLIFAAYFIVRYLIRCSEVDGLGISLFLIVLAIFEMFLATYHVKASEWALVNQDVRELKIVEGRFLMGSDGKFEDITEEDIRFENSERQEVVKETYVNSSIFRWMLKHKEECKYLILMPLE